MRRILHKPPIEKNHTFEKMKDTRFGMALNSLTSDHKSIFVSLFFQWFMKDKKFAEMLQQAPQEIKSVWDQITNNQLSTAQIVEDYKKYMQTTTNETVKELEKFQNQLRT